MDKKCMLVNFDDKHIILESGPVSKPVVVHTKSLLVAPGGSLPKGIYYYTVTAIGVNGESAPFNYVQVNASYDNNVVYLNWEPTPFITEYRVYRGTSIDSYDGHFTVFTRTGKFVDQGLVEPIGNKKPPEATPVPDMWDKTIHRDAIKKISSLFLGGDPCTIHIYLQLVNGEVVTIDLLKVMNKPGWHSTQKFGLLKAIAEIGEWKDADRS